jgi:hypothetical protein
MTEGKSFDDREFQFFDQDGKFAITMNAIPSGFGPE